MYIVFVTGVRVSVCPNFSVRMRECKWRLLFCSHIFWIYAENTEYYVINFEQYMCECDFYWIGNGQPVIFHICFVFYKTVIVFCIESTVRYIDMTRGPVCLREH